MTLTITHQQRVELNSILALLRSPDHEAAELGFEMLQSNAFVATNLSSMYYIPREGKEIPISWYFRKARQIKEINLEHPDKYQNEYWRLVIPFLESILNGESSKFKAFIYFNFEVE